MLCCAGQGLNIPAGHWYIVSFPKESIVLDHRWFTLSSSVQGLLTTFRLKALREKRWEFKSLVPGNIILRKEWVDVVQANTARFNHEVIQPFTFAPPKHGGARVPSMCLRLNFQPTGLASQRYKWGELGVLGALAREAVEQVNKGKLLLEGSRDVERNRRGWGRLTSWCKANMGRTAYQREHDITKRGGKRPSKFLKGSDEDEESEEEEVVEDSDVDVEDPEREDMGVDEGEEPQGQDQDEEDDFVDETDRQWAFRFA
jgi:hypothetical protein